jgi:hypothetical protein
MTQVPPGDLDVAVFGQLPPTQFALGNPLETGPLEVVAFEAPLRGRALPQKPLKHAPWDPDNAFVLADGNAKFHGLLLGIPAGIRGKSEEHAHLRFRGLECSSLVHVLANCNVSVHDKPSSICPV